MLRRGFDRLNHRAGGRDAGVTLVELLVTMLIGTIIGAFTLTWFVGANKTAHATLDKDIRTTGARNALQGWASLLEVAGSPTVPGTGSGRISAISPTSITFYAQLNGTSCSTDAKCAAFGLKQVGLRLQNGSLQQSMAGAGYNVVAPSPITASGCLFTLWAGQTNLGCDGTALTAADLATVTRVDIAFVSTDTTGRARSYSTSASFTTWTAPEATDVPVA